MKGPPRRQGMCGGGGWGKGACGRGGVRVGGLRRPGRRQRQEEQSAWRRGFVGDLAGEGKDGPWRAGEAEGASGRLGTAELEGKERLGTATSPSEGTEVGRRLSCGEAVHERSLGYRAPG